MRILLLEPYYGGSHKAFLHGLMRHLPFTFDLHTLPARKWKWRMRLAAPYFAELLSSLGPYDRVLCSTFVDVAALRSLGPSWLRRVPVLTYYHENQFAYPVQEEDERDFHFALTNFTTALASDRLAFNSDYNRASFLKGCREILKKAPDMKGIDEAETVRAKAAILYPGIDFDAIDREPDRGEGEGDPVIVWNHRWEHDKNPEFFFQTLFDLDAKGVAFELIILGESFNRQPPIFKEARERLAHRILHFGYVPSRREYVRWLKRADLVISTATHEFYGISVIEAVRAGCRPLLPRRLSYPELFPEEFLYDDTELPSRLLNDLRKKRLDRKVACALTEGFSWKTLAERYQHWFLSGCKTYES